MLKVKRNTLIWTISLIASLSGFSQMGCSSPKLAYDIPTDVSFEKFQSVALDTRQETVLIIDGLRPVRPGPIRDLVFREMVEKRYVASPMDQADLLLVVHTLVKSGSGMDGMPSGGQSSGGGPGRGGPGGGGMMPGSGGGRGMSGDRPDGMGMPGMGGPGMGDTPSAGSGMGRPGPGGRDAQMGGTVTLVLEVIERATGRRVWFGQSEVSLPDDPQDSLRLQDEIRKFLVPFPSKGAVPENIKP
jgi:hypothetical protein